MQKIFDEKAPKKSANLSINSDLLQKARECGINLSALLEQSLIDYVKKTKSEKWREENRDAIDAYNEYVDNNGTFSDDLRSF
jgi:antitoxin CcdA